MKKVKVDFTQAPCGKIHHEVEIEEDRKEGANEQCWPCGCFEYINRWGGCLKICTRDIPKPDCIVDKI
jgi:hypothetical protein